MNGTELRRQTIADPVALRSGHGEQLMREHPRAAWHAQKLALFSDLPTLAYGAVVFLGHRDL
jgi:hypothetical protein